MGDILEQFQHIFAIAAFRGSGQPQNKLRMEVGEDLLVGIGRSMVAFIHDQVVKIRRRELFQILGDTLHRCKNDRLGHILLTSGIFPQCSLRPHFRKRILSL